MKDAIKMTVSHFFIICVCVMTAIGTANLFAAEGFKGYGLDFPFHILLIGATSALPSMLFYFRREPTRKQFLLRTVLHFFCILAVVLGEGFLLGWYQSVAEALVIAGIIVIVYIVVWLITLRSGNKTEERINEALKRINNEEGQSS